MGMLNWSLRRNKAKCHEVSESVMNGPEAPQHREIKPVWVYLIVTLAFASIMTIGRAYRTDDMDVFLRSALWLVVCGLIVSQVLLLDHWISCTARWLKNRWISGGLSIAATTVLMAVELDLLKHTPLLPKEHDPFLEFVMFMFAPVLVMGVLVLTLKWRLDWYGIGISKPAVEAASAGTQELATLHEWPETRICWVNAQEHYLRIQTQDQEHFIRGRMRDAVLRLADADGLQVHRSWWVAGDEIEHVKKTGRDYQLTLRSGRIVPVARSRVSNLRAKGWLAK